MDYAGPQPQRACSLVWALPRSLAATEGIVLTFSSSGYLDVSVHRVPRIRLWIHLMLTYLPYAVFPHSDIHGSKPACGSPWLFAACHVLHRRLVPGHPPYALVRLIFFNPETIFQLPLLRLRFRVSAALLFFTSYSRTLCLCTYPEEYLHATGLHTLLYVRFLSLVLFVQLSRCVPVSLRLQDSFKP